MRYIAYGTHSQGRGVTYRASLTQIPWALRGVISDPAVLSLFASEIAELRQAFDDWQPKTTLLKDLRRKLEPIQSLRVLPPSPLAVHAYQEEPDNDKPLIVRGSKL